VAAHPAVENLPSDSGLAGAISAGVVRDRDLIAEANLDGWRRAAG